MRKVFSATPVLNAATAGPTFEVHDPKLVAYDKMTGNVMGEVVLPRNATGAPMTYVLDGKQFIVLATGGGMFQRSL